jgi:CRISPR system Cascade subunit CasC
MGDTEFGAGVFYLYVCVDCDSLLSNLSGHSDLAKKAVAGLIEVAAKVSPTGKQNSFASRAYASYILAEKGEQQPRSLAVSFLRPVEGEDMLPNAIRRLEDTRNKLDTVYGKCWDECAALNAEGGAGTLAALMEFGKRCVS